MKHISVISRKPLLAQEFTLGQTLSIVVDLLNVLAGYYLTKPDVPSDEKNGEPSEGT